MAATSMSYFPRGAAENPSKITKFELPIRPDEYGPVFDVEHSEEPIPAFDPEVYGQVYGGPSETGEAIEPTPPVDFNDKYLFPCLSQNERLRLTLLWYHTSAIEQDELLLSKIDTLVKGVQQAIGWEYAIAGILDESTYTRLATAHLPIARLPRREATCAHTINQAPSSVFMITDMSKDWRFKESPHVEIGGLRSYAGTQLRLLADDGEEISLGSLCVASDTPQPPLSKVQSDLLVRFAELISSTIASHTRQRRLKIREKMGMLLSTLQNEVELDYERNAVEIIRKAYPTAHVSLQISSDGKLAVEGRPVVLFSEVTGGLWEDTQFIENAIRSYNYKNLVSTQTVRAVVARCGSSSDKYLVVASNDIHHVFDDFDAWYVSKAALIIADALHSRQLQQALEARETFLRGMTHQLRTPIHGILGSVELLAEELATMARKRSIENGLVTADSNSISTSPAACIATIKNSGQELMTTVNNILKHNTWTDTLRQSNPGPYDLNNLESDILPELLRLLPPERLQGVSIDFRQEVMDGRCMFTTDAQLLKDCLQPIVMNALQSVLDNPSGVVSMTIRSTCDFSWLLFDVVDNGCGIGCENHKRIFEPYEKVDSHKLGAGLGLTLASKIAKSLRGSVTLVSSARGSGSHFRVEFQNPVIAASVPPAEKPVLALKNIPRNYSDICQRGPHSHFVSHLTEYLTRNGFQRTHFSDAGLIITNGSMEETVPQLRTASARAATIKCGPMVPSETIGQEPTFITVNGPLHTRKLDQILQQADELYSNISEELAKKQLVTENDTTSPPIPPPSAEEPQSPEIVSKSIANLSLKDAPSPTQQNSISLLKALLVDDNLINLRVLQMFCHKRQIPYVTAEDGNRALEQYKTAVANKEPFALVLMDLQMPHCDGIQATAAIRAYEKAHNVEKIPIFMVTGQDSAKDKASSRSAGADEFLVKPVGPKQLDKHIKKYFDNYIPKN